MRTPRARRIGIFQPHNGKNGMGLPAFEAAHFLGPSYTRFGLMSERGQSISLRAENSLEPKQYPQDAESRKLGIP